MISARPGRGVIEHLNGSGPVNIPCGVLYYTQVSGYKWRIFTLWYAHKSTGMGSLVAGSIAWSKLKAQTKFIVFNIYSGCVSKSTQILGSKISLGYCSRVACRHRTSGFECKSQKFIEKIYCKTHSTGTKDQSMPKVRFVDTWFSPMLWTEVSIRIEYFRVVVDIRVVIDTPWEKWVNDSTIRFRDLQEFINNIAPLGIK